MASRSAAFPAPQEIGEFGFGKATLSSDGTVELGYRLDDRLRFTERVSIPVGDPLSDERIEDLTPLVDLLHWVAGVSYYKAAAPPRIAFDGRRPGPRTSTLLHALYSEGLGEFAVRNRLPLPRPEFSAAAGAPDGGPSEIVTDPNAVLVPVGGGKDSIVALEALRTTGRRVTLFSVGEAEPIRATIELAALPWLRATRRIDPELLAYNEAGALNGHVPVTAIVSCIALLTAAANGLALVAMANERSASTGNVAALGIDVNHQFSKGLAAERLLSDALAEAAAGLSYASVLRGAGELAITRTFADLGDYHQAFRSCNASFRIDESRRATNWCGECPKCRFVFLALAPWLEPSKLTAIFGRNLLDEPDQYDDFALLAAIGGHKPFECVGEEEEAIAAFRLLAQDPRWSTTAVVSRFATEVLPELPSHTGRPEAVLDWSDEHELSPELATSVRAFLSARG